MLCARMYLRPPFQDWTNKLKFTVLGMNIVPLEDTTTPQSIVSAIDINKMADA